VAYAAFGYARVSSKEQNHGRQIDALCGAGIEMKDIFVDKSSGKDFERSEYKRLKARLCTGDLLMVTSIDRLGRNYNEILREWKEITKDMGAHIKVLDLPLLDTTKSGKDLTSSFISDIVLQILSYVAEQERVNIHQRQAEGIALAKAQGKHLGRPKAKRPESFDTVYSQWKNGSITFDEVLALLKLKRSTFYKFAMETRNV